MEEYPLFTGIRSVGVAHRSEAQAASKQAVCIGVWEDHYRIRARMAAATPLLVVVGLQTRIAKKLKGLLLELQCRRWLGFQKASHRKFGGWLFYHV